MTPRRNVLWAVAICIPLLTACGFVARGGLWRVVHDVCVPDQQTFSSPAPCTEVNLAAGYVILRDPNPFAPTHFLLVPTVRLRGIEDPALLAPGVPNYWDQAWQNRRYVDQRVGRVLGRDELSLAVNSLWGRTQDQLHIHIDCIKPAVKAALQSHASAVGPDWAPFPVPLVGERYLARRVEGSDLAGTDPFRLLAALPEARAAMFKESLVVVGETGADGRPGFILLAGRTLPGYANKWGEELQDHRCALARSTDWRVARPTTG